MVPHFSDILAPITDMIATETGCRNLGYSQDELQASDASKSAIAEACS